MKHGDTETRRKRGRGGQKAAAPFQQDARCDHRLPSLTKTTSRPAGQPPRATWSPERVSSRRQHLFLVVDGRNQRDKIKGRDMRSQALGLRICQNSGAGNREGASFEFLVSLPLVRRTVSEHLILKNTSRSRSVM